MVGQQVGTDLTCWATIDPGHPGDQHDDQCETTIPPQYEPLLAESEYGGNQPHSFAGLARRGSTLAKLSDLSADDRRSGRLQTVWRPLGIDQELRLMFLVDGTSWGAAGMVRTGAETPAAQEWRDRLDEIAPGRFAVVMQVMANGARTAASGGFRARVRDAQG